jgi:ferredoxin-like protein FixX
MNFRKSHNPGLLEFTADEVECLECGLDHVWICDSRSILKWKNLTKVQRV